MSEQTNLIPRQPTDFFSSFICTRLVHKNKNVERGGKMILPEWVVGDLDRMRLPLPYVFMITNPLNKRFTHAGVLQFSLEEEDQVQIPKWLMEFLSLEEGQSVHLRTVSLPTATYCKLQPLTSNSAYISNTKSVLEKNLQFFACLTEGDIISVHEINKNQTYKFKVAQTLPEPAVNILLDCEVDLDFDVPIKRQFEKCENTQKVKRKSFKPFEGQGYKLNKTNAENEASESKTATNIPAEEQSSKKHKPGGEFVPFGGAGCSLTINKLKRKRNQDDIGPASKKQHTINMNNYNDNSSNIAGLQNPNENEINSHEKEEISSDEVDDL